MTPVTLQTSLAGDITYLAVKVGPTMYSSYINDEEISKNLHSSLGSDEQIEAYHYCIEHTLRSNSVEFDEIVVEEHKGKIKTWINY